MRKIFELTEKEFMTGIAPSSQVQNKGLWHKAKGITVVRDIFLESDNVGLLQAGPAPTDLTGSVIQDVPFAWTTDVSTSGTEKLYSWGNAGWLYVINISGDNNPTAITGTAQGSAANGLFLMNHSDGTKKLYYFRLADIGYYGDLNATPSLNTAEYTGLQSTAYHPCHKFFDRQYFGNGRYVGLAEDDGSGGLTLTNDALDFEKDERVQAIDDDGTYLVIGTSNNQNTDSLVHGRTRVVFWDTNQSSWQREWSIPDASILGIRKVGAHMEALTTRGLFAFSFNSPPVPLVPYLLTGDVPDYQYPAQFATDVVGEAMLFGGDTRISSFGKLTPAMPNAFFQPFAGFTGAVTMVAAQAKTNDIIVGTASSKLYRVKLTGSGATGVSGETIYIDLGRWWQVGRVVLGFDGQLASGDDVNIDVQPDDSTSSSDWGSATYTSHGAIRTKEIYNSIEARKLKLIVNFNGGTPRIRNIQVWGDPIETPTHTRT